MCAMLFSKSLFHCHLDDRLIDGARVPNETINNSQTSFFFFLSLFFLFFFNPWKQDQLSQSELSLGNWNRSAIRAHAHILTMISVLSKSLALGFIYPKNRNCRGLTKP